MSEAKAEAKRDAAAKAEANRDPAMVAAYRLLRASQDEEAALAALKSEALEPSQRLPG